jgi:two-component system, OmpR family, phosphate regulon response regulator PhoB
MPSRVMIVEDDLSLAELLHYNLVAAGFDVEHVERGDMAEERISAVRPDVLVLDWSLPGTSGIELCRRLRRKLDARLLPIIMLTARTSVNDRDYALLMGVDHYLTKPFVVKELLAEIAKLIGLHARARPSP